MHSFSLPFNRGQGPALSPEHCIQLRHERPSCTVAATAARNQGTYSDTRGDGWSRSRLHLRPCPGSPRIPSTEQLPAPVPPPNRVLAAPLRSASSPLRRNSAPRRSAPRRLSLPRKGLHCRALPLAVACSRLLPHAATRRRAPPLAAARRCSLLCVAARRPAPLTAAPRHPKPPRAAARISLPLLSPLLPPIAPPARAPCPCRPATATGNCWGPPPLQRGGRRGGPQRSCAWRTATIGP